MTDIFTTQDEVRRSGCPLNLHIWISNVPVSYVSWHISSVTILNFEQVGSGEIFSIAEEEPGGKDGGKGRGGHGGGGQGGGGGGGQRHKEETEVLLSPR